MRRLALLLGLFAGAAGIAAAAGTPAAEQTHPRAHPASGTRHTGFSVAFTLRHDAGHQGVAETVYLLRVTPPAGARRRCTPPAQRSVTRGTAGVRRRVALRPPSAGWCPGRHRVRVVVQSGPYCPPGQERPCPLFPTTQQAAGATSFRVRAPAR